jgi:hypothetical protein
MAMHPILLFGYLTGFGIAHDDCRSVLRRPVKHPTPKIVLDNPNAGMGVKLDVGGSSRWVSMQETALPIFFTLYIPCLPIANDSRRSNRWIAMQISVTIE